MIRKEWEEIAPQLQLEDFSFVFVMLLGPEQFPRIGEIVFDVEEHPALSRQVFLSGVVGRAAEKLATLARGVIVLYDYVGKAVAIEEIVFDGQLDSPAANRSQVFEGEVTLIAEVELEHAGIVSSG
jgi:hypothetical protein